MHKVKPQPPKQTKQHPVLPCDEQAFHSQRYLTDRLTFRDSLACGCCRWDEMQAKRALSGAQHTISHPTSCLLLQAGAVEACTSQGTAKQNPTVWQSFPMHPLLLPESQNTGQTRSFQSADGLLWAPFQPKESPSSCTAYPEQVDNSQNSTVGNTLPLTSSSHSNQIVNKQSILHRWTNNATLIQLPRTIFCAYSIKSSHSACSSWETRTGSPSEGEHGRGLTLMGWQLWASSLCSTLASCCNLTPVCCGSGPPQ